MFFAFPLWIDGAVIGDDVARTLGLSGPTIIALTEYGRLWDETFDARQIESPVPTWAAVDELGHALAMIVAQELDETWTVHHLSLQDKRRWAWTGGSCEQVYL